MRVSYGFPSGNYNLFISEDEIEQLLKKGYISAHAAKIPCTTSRLIFNSEKKEMEVLDRKEIENLLLFHTDEDVADIKAGDHYVQFIGIVVEQRKEK